MSLKFKSSFLKNTAKENEKKSHRPGEDICQMHIWLKAIINNI